MLYILKNKKGISPYIVVAVIAILVLLAVVLVINQQPKDETVTPLTNNNQVGVLPLDTTNDQQPFIQLSAQSIADGKVIVDNLYTTQPSWLVIYNSDESGMPKEVIGNLALTSGLFSDLSVPISTTTSSSVLWAIIHVDEGEVGKFEFPDGVDLPLLVNNQIVATSFTAVQADRELTTEEPVEEIKTFAISGKNFTFSQKEIRVKKGDRVKIDFTSTDGFHDWVIDEFAAATEKVNTGGSTSVEFVADQVGTFEYYCSVGQHRAMGMVGKLIVEE